MRPVFPSLIAITLATAATAQDHAHDGLLDFGWMTEVQRVQVAAAHEALANAEAAMCETMVSIYAEHAARVHGGEGIDDEELAFQRRRCEAEAHADHVAQSIAIHGALHAEIHAGGHEDH